MKKLLTLLMLAVLLLTVVGCDYTPSADDKERDAQEQILSEGLAQVGMPAIKNFREKKMMKDILELRDQTGLITYAYIENMVPTIIEGHTSLGGKFSYLGETVGYGLPYATQYTNPLKIAYVSSAGVGVINQADPSGLFSPSSAEGTWVMMRDPSGKKGTKVVYIESRISIFPFKLPID